MRKISVFLGIVLVAFTLFACGSKDPSGEASANGNEGETHTIKIGHALSEEHTQHKTFEKFKEYVEKESDNKIEVEIFPNGEIGDDEELIESVEVGTVTMAAPSTAPVANFVPEFELFDLPFLFEDRDTAFDVLDGELGSEVLELLEDVGIVGLGYWENGFRNLTNNIGPVHTPDDLAGMDIRTMETPMHISTWEKLGANPTPMAWGDVFVSLQQGTLDGQENPLGTIYDQNVYEVQDYLTLTQHVYAPFAVLINQDFYEGLDEGLQKIINDGVEVATEENRKLVVETDEKTVDLLEAEGMEVNELSAEELEVFKDMTESVYEEYKEKIGEELVERVLGLTN